MYVLNKQWLSGHCWEGIHSLPMWTNMGGGGGRVHLTFFPWGDLFAAFNSMQHRSGKGLSFKRPLLQLLPLQSTESFGWTCLDAPRLAAMAVATLQLLHPSCPPSFVHAIANHSSVVYILNPNINILQLTKNKCSCPQGE